MENQMEKKRKHEMNAGIIAFTDAGQFASFLFAEVGCGD